MSDVTSVRAELSLVARETVRVVREGAVAAAASLAAAFVAAAGAVALLAGLVALLGVLSDGSAVRAVAQIVLGTLGASAAISLPGLFFAAPLAGFLGAAGGEPGPAAALRRLRRSWFLAGCLGLLVLGTTGLVAAWGSAVAGVVESAARGRPWAGEIATLLVVGGVGGFVDAVFSGQLALGSAEVLADPPQRRPPDRVLDVLGWRTWLAPRVPLLVVQAALCAGASRTAFGPMLAPAVSESLLLATALSLWLDAAVTAAIFGIAARRATGAPEPEPEE